MKSKILKHYNYKERSRSWSKSWRWSWIWPNFLFKHESWIKSRLYPKLWK